MQNFVLVPFEQVFQGTRETWMIEQCGGELHALVTFGCIIGLKALSADEAEVVPDFPCDLTEGSATVHMRTTGGSVKRSDGGLAASVSWRGQEPVSQGNVQADYNAQLTASSPGKDRSTVALCGAQASPAPPDDYSILGGCAARQFVDRTAADAERVVTYDQTNGFQPRCLRIGPGQAAVFSGNFRTDSLFPGTADQSLAGTAPNPIKAIFVPDMRRVEFPQTGDFIYHCTNCPQLSSSIGMVRVR
ncbi:MAG: hypothetical protein Q8L14_25170 [Myxococcales bacterium]|nr:hypothetical protein [Myxococcales bacterium]